MYGRLHPRGDQAFVVSAVARVIPLKRAAGNREAELIAQGWAKQTTIGEPRLSELVELYRALGYEVEKQVVGERAVHTFVRRKTN